MKLSPAFVMQHLKLTHTVFHSGELSKLPCLDKLYFYTGEISLKENSLYLLDNSPTPKEPLPIPASTLVIQMQEEHTLPQKLQANYCLVQGAGTVTSLFNQIQELFHSLGKWQEILMHTCLQEEPVQKLLEVSYPFLKKSLALLDRDYSVIASTSDDNIAPEIESFKQSGLSHRTLEYKGYYYPNPRLGTNSLCVNIKKNGQTTHQLLMLEEKHSPNECYGFLLEYLAEMVQHTLARNTQKDRTLHSLLQMILTDKSADSDSISQQLNNLGWYHNDCYFCIVIESTSMKPPTDNLHSICNFIENTVSNSCAFYYKKHVVTYINQTQAQFLDSTVSNKLIYYIRDNLLKAGYSRCMSGHAHLYWQYVQACAALDIGKYKHPNTWIHHFDEISLDYILAETTKKLPGYMISHEKLLKLKYMDDSHHTEYIKTLRCYLNNHCNAVQTAKALYIHRSTFLYRLDKIKDILQTDLNDPDEVLYLMLSFHFLEMEKNENFMPLHQRPHN